MAMRFALMENTAINPTAMPAFKSLILVPWEDSFFSILGIYFFKDFLKLSKKFWIPIAIAFSVIFASGHISYGYPWAAITLSFPYFVSYHYGKKYGYGTIFVMHILYDFSTVLTIKLSMLFNLFKW